MPGEPDGDQAVRLARRIAGTARIALVLAAEQAFGIRARGQALRARDVARILLRLREVDGDVEIAELRRRLPDDVLVDAVLADVVRRDGELVELIGRGLRAAAVVVLEPADDLGRARHHAVHDARVEEVALLRRILDEPLARRVVEHLLEDGCRRRQRLLDVVLRRELRHLEHIEQAVRHVVTILLLHEVLLYRKMNQAIDFMIDRHLHPFLSLHASHTKRGAPARKPPSPVAEGFHVTAPPIS